MISLVKEIEASVYITEGIYDDNTVYVSFKHCFILNEDPRIDRNVLEEVEIDIHRPQ